MKNNKFTKHNVEINDGLRKGFILKLQQTGFPDSATLTQKYFVYLDQTTLSPRLWSFLQKCLL